MFFLYWASLLIRKKLQKDLKKIKHFVMYVLLVFYAYVVF